MNNEQDLLDKLGAIKNMWDEEQALKDHHERAKSDQPNVLSKETTSTESNKNTENQDDLNGLCPNP